MGRAAERLGDSNPTPRGHEDDLLVRMTAVWLRNSTAAMLQSYVAALPFFPCFLFSRNRKQLLLLLARCKLLSVSEDTPEQTRVPHRPETKETIGSILPGP